MYQVSRDAISAHIFHNHHRLKTCSRKGAIRTDYFQLLRQVLIRIDPDPFLSTQARRSPCQGVVALTCPEISGSGKAKLRLSRLLYRHGAQWVACLDTRNMALRSMRLTATQMASLRPFPDLSWVGRVWPQPQIRTEQGLELIWVLLWVRGSAGLYDSGLHWGFRPAPVLVAGPFLDPTSAPAGSGKNTATWTSKCVMSPCVYAS